MYYAGFVNERGSEREGERINTHVYELLSGPGNKNGPLRSENGSLMGVIYIIAGCHGRRPRRGARPSCTARGLGVRPTSSGRCRRTKTTRRRGRFRPDGVRGPPDGVSRSSGFPHELHCASRRPRIFLLRPRSRFGHRNYPSVIRSSGLVMISFRQGGK